MVLAGHQAQMWHPGILAKALAQAAAARSLGAGGAWVVVDQDDHDPWTIRYPVRTAEGSLEVRQWRVGGEHATGPEHVPIANGPAARPSGIPALERGERFGAPGVGEGLDAIRAAIGRHAGERSAARQIGAAMQELLRPIAPDMATVFATDLARTEVFAQVVEAIGRDPAAAVGAYNRATRAHPGARIAPLRADGDAELPLWHIPAKAGAARRRVPASMLGSIPVEELAPRALLMTGVLRMAGCEMFVHGLGGAGGDGSSGYDAITTAWFREWLGADLAPTATVSATLRLNLEPPGSGARPTPEQIARARWTAHAARHRPRMLGDAAAEAQREEALATLRRLRGKRDAPSKRSKLEAYRGLHKTLEAARARRPAELARYESEAAAAAAYREEAEIIADRTWAWPLYEAGQIAELRRAIDAAFGL